ncbi:hypothetical protein [Halococcus hamelinensis]|uniref:Uncharacterized protein n=1 Tax=Halococcus hamelinensis 100A6 TaxID=1132509 RepID=M0LSJ2_9EURY|nr:hypothetical protein [Halococcus hamelinensis]EMA36502.1 hypothetical protein C447_14631 [Halococcus hamelinensis 100A6]
MKTMTQTSHENRTATTDPSSPDTPDSPAVLLRNEDDTTHDLDVRIAGGDTVLAEGRHTVAGDSQRTVITGTGDETLRVDLRADHGGCASLTVDFHRSPVPEFVVRRDTILVAGLH